MCSIAMLWYGGLHNAGRRCMADILSVSFDLSSSANASRPAIAWRRAERSANESSSRVLVPGTPNVTLRHGEKVPWLLRKVRRNTTAVLPGFRSARDLFLICQTHSGESSHACRMRLKLSMSRTAVARRLQATERLLPNEPQHQTSITWSCGTSFTCCESDPGNDCRHRSTPRTSLCWQSRLPDRPLEQHADRTIPGLVHDGPTYHSAARYDASNE